MVASSLWGSMSRMCDADNAVATELTSVSIVPHFKDLTADVAAEQAKEVCDVDTTDRSASIKAVYVTEWISPSQIAPVRLSARYHAPFQIPEHLLERAEEATWRAVEGVHHGSCHPTPSGHEAIGTASPAPLWRRSVVALRAHIPTGLACTIRSKGSCRRRRALHPCRLVARAREQHPDLRELPTLQPSGSEGYGSFDTVARDSNGGRLYLPISGHTSGSGPADIGLRVLWARTHTRSPGPRTSALRAAPLHADHL